MALFVTILPYRIYYIFKTFSKTQAYIKKSRVSVLVLLVRNAHTTLFGKPLEKSTYVNLPM